MSKRLFENLRLLILLSPELSDEETAKVLQICQNHNIPNTVKDIAEAPSNEEFVSSGFTHIISNTSVFDLYDFAQEKLVPVTTAQYIIDLDEKERALSVRPYSPDPKHVLKDIIVCCGGLPTSDKEAIYGGVRALGGSYNESLGRYVTHLISADEDEDCVIAVKSISGFEIKIVHPRWIDHCLKLRKRLDETRYILGYVPTEEEKDEEEKIEKLNAATDSSQRIKFLKGKKFYLGKDLDLTEAARSRITSMIVDAGGVVVDSLNECKFYIGHYRDGAEYITACRSKLYVGSMNWVYWMVEHQKWISPYCKLLHHPLVRGGMEEFKDFVVSSSNYTGDARYYIKCLVESLGATFSANLKASCTHLISGSLTGKKYNAALRWNIQVINHLWLEECYANWKLLPEKHPRYASTFGDKITFSEIVGETPLDIEVLKKFYEVGVEEGINTTMVTDSEDEEEGMLFAQVNRTKKTIEVEPDTMPQRDDAITNAFQTEPKDELDEADEKSRSQTPVNHPKVNYDSSDTAETTGEANKDEDKENIKTESASRPLSTSKSNALTPKKPDNISQAPPQIDTPGAKTGSSTATPLRHTSGRKAKDKATLKLHADMEELNYFQKQHKSKEVPLLPHEIEERKRKREEELLKKEAKKSASAEPEETPMKGKKTKKGEHEDSPNSKKVKKEPSVSHTPYKITAICSGLELDIPRSGLMILQNLGITISKELKDDINAIVAPKFMRTEKFLVGLSYELEFVLCPEFLTDVVKHFKEHPNSPEDLPDIEQYSMAKVDPKSVKALTPLPLEELLQKCRNRIYENKRLFQGLTFNITSKIPGGATTATKILKAHGAKDVKVIKAIKDLKTIKILKPSTDGSFLFLSLENGFNARFKELLNENKAKGKIVGWEWVVSSIFKMDLDDGNVIFKSSK